MKKTRTIKEKYLVCDFCGEELDYVEGSMGWDGIEKNERHFCEDCEGHDDQVEKIGLCDSCVKKFQKHVILEKQKEE